MGQRAPRPALLAFAGQAYALAGRVEEAVAMLERSLETAAARRHLSCTSLWTCWTAGAYLQAGRHTDAEQTAVRAIELARKHRERGFEGYALHQFGDVVAAGEPAATARADEAYQQALVIAEELGMRPLEAHCRRSLGQQYRRAGRTHEARAELNVAIDLYLSMGMTHWLAEAEAALAATTASPSAEPVG
jgi:tetratricopeptide (TPR) repeat protein